MPPELSDRQTVPLSVDDRKRLRQVAAELDVSPGLLARALILFGLQKTSDPDLLTRIAGEMSAAHARASEAGKTAMKSRYGDNDDKAAGQGSTGDDADENRA